MSGYCDGCGYTECVCDELPPAVPAEAAATVAREMAKARGDEFGAVLRVAGADGTAISRRLRVDPRFPFDIDAEDGLQEGVATVAQIIADDRTREERIADAHRLAASWNACRGMPDPEADVADLQAEIDRFGYALEAIAELDGDCKGQQFKLTRFQASQVARAALAAVQKGGG